MNKEKRAKIIGTGSYLPPYVVDNEYLCRFYPGKGPAWIQEKTGIKERRFGFDFETNKMRDGFYDDDLAEKAAQVALEKADVRALELSLIIRVTCTPEYLFFPDAACVLHRRLGASRDCAAFTIPAGCGGLVYALKTADNHIKANSGKAVIIVASHVPSSFGNVEDSRIVVRDWLNGAIFGDGASALLLKGLFSNQEGIIASYLGSWPKDDPMIYPAGGSRSPTSPANVYEHWYQMDSRAVFLYAGSHLKYAIRKLQEKFNFFLEDVDWFLFHQANLRILERLATELEIPMEKILVNVDRYGNTSAASIGILLDEGVREGKIRKGNLLLLVGVGAGWQYGAILIRW